MPSIYGLNPQMSIIYQQTTQQQWYPMHSPIHVTETLSYSIPTYSIRLTSQLPTGLNNTITPVPPPTPPIIPGSHTPVLTNRIPPQPLPLLRRRNLALTPPHSLRSRSPITPRHTRRLLRRFRRMSPSRPNRTSQIISRSPLPRQRTRHLGIPGPDPASRKMISKTRPQKLGWRFS